MTELLFRDDPYLRSAEAKVLAVREGGVLAIIVLMLRAIGWSEQLRERVALLRPKAGIPYGVAIAAGTLIAIALQR